MALTIGIVILLLGGAAVRALVYDPDRPATYDDAVEHFKYGSIGGETELAGIPYWIWAVMPQTFPDLLPGRPGNGYERFGFVYETPASARPIGVSLRQRQVPLVGLNCATCHTGTIRDSPDAAPRIVLGMPSHQLDLQAYGRFLLGAARDPRFNADTLIPAIQQINPGFSWRDRLFYRYVVVPLSKRAFNDAEPQFTWQGKRPEQGPGRVDTFNPYKVLFQMPMDSDDTVGSADLPTLFDQKSKDGLALHWDGNNTSMIERNKSAAMGAGCTEASLDISSLKRVEDWIWELRGPAFPTGRIDTTRLARGEALYRQHCADCHDAGGSRLGKVIPLEEIGTDPERVRSFTPELSQRMNTLGAGRAWRFSHFRKTNGYVSMLLDSVWLRSPYLHNGSVPTLRDLLNRPEQRPAVFYRGYDVYDYVDVGFVSSGADAARTGHEYRTDLRGNRNSGHLYGTDLPAGDKADLIEFLKSR
jgi:hypothetical protein